MKVSVWVGTVEVRLVVEKRVPETLPGRKSGLRMSRFRRTRKMSSHRNWPSSDGRVDGQHRRRAGAFHATTRPPEQRRQTRETGPGRGRRKRAPPGGHDGVSGGMRKVSSDMAAVPEARQTAIRMLLCQLRIPHSTFRIKAKRPFGNRPKGRRQTAGNRRRSFGDDYCIVGTPERCEPLVDHVREVLTSVLVLIFTPAVKRRDRSSCCR